MINTKTACFEDAKLQDFFSPGIHYQMNSELSSISSGSSENLELELNANPVKSISSTKERIMLLNMTLNTSECNGLYNSKTSISPCFSGLFKRYCLPSSSHLHQLYRMSSSNPCCLFGPWPSRILRNSTQKKHLLMKCFVCICLTADHFESCIQSWTHIY